MAVAEMVADPVAVHVEGVWAVPACRVAVRGQAYVSVISTQTGKELARIATKWGGMLARIRFLENQG